MTTGATVYPNRLIKSLGFSRYNADINLIPSLLGASDASTTDTSISPVIDKEMVDVLAISNIVDSLLFNYVLKTK